MSLEDEKKHKETVSIIGAGKVGTAVAHLLDRAGYRIAYLCARSEETLATARRHVEAPVTQDLRKALEGAQVVLLTVPDDAIYWVAARLAEFCDDLEGKIIVHKSGAHGLGALGPVRRRGAKVLAIHPLQTFADVEGAISALPGSIFGVSCEPGMREWAERFVRDLGGEAFFLDDSSKGLYHASAVIACNFMTVLEYCAEMIYRELGMTSEDAREALVHLMKATLKNIERMGPVDALTGPMIRGDLQTLRYNLSALSEFDDELCELYRVITLCGLRIAEERGTMEGERIEGMRRLLEGRED